MESQGITQQRITEILDAKGIEYSIDTGLDGDDDLGLQMIVTVFRPKGWIDFRTYSKSSETLGLTGSPDVDIPQDSLPQVQAFVDRWDPNSDLDIWFSDPELLFRNLFIFDEGLTDQELDELLVQVIAELDAAFDLVFAEDWATKVNYG